MRSIWPRSPRAEAVPAAPFVPGGETPLAPPALAAARHGIVVPGGAAVREDRLPPAAAAKRRRLLAAQQDLGEIARALASSRTDLVDQRNRARENLRAQTEARHDRSPILGPAANLGAGRIPTHRPPPGGIATAEAELAAIEREIAEIDERSAANNLRRSAAPARIDAWLGALPAGAVLELHNASVKLPKGEFKTIIEAARADVVRLRADSDRVRTAPYPARVAHERVRAFVDGMAQRGEPDVLRVIELNLDPGFAMTSLQPHAAPPIPTPDALALLAWLHKDLLIASMLSLIDELAGDDREALDDDQRRERQADIAAELLRAERLEEAAIEAAEASGSEIKRRDDASPIAVLGLAEPRLSGRK